MKKPKKKLDRSKYENLFFEAGFDYVIGIDEVGRGAGAGPIYCCAFLVNRDDLHRLQSIEGLRDSKKITPNKRHLIYEQLKFMTSMIIYGSVEEINCHGINIINKRIMERAIETLVRNIDHQPDFKIAILIDGNMKLDIPYETKYLVRGDDRSLTIAAASVIAKEIRDEYMIDIVKNQIGTEKWEFHKNKGYLTQAHREALKKWGSTEYHRTDFIRKIV